VNNKYDQWHREILNKFGSKLGEGMRSFNATIANARLQLENQSIDSSDVIEFVTAIQEMKKNVEIWQAEMNRYTNG
jgi:dynein heavy chain 1